MPRKRSSPTRGSSRGGTSFNEAAARCRGKVAACQLLPGPRGRFNEAAARCRGKVHPLAPQGRQRVGFNEAAARCRGKGRTNSPRGSRPRKASMRPRPDAAEKDPVAHLLSRYRRASMRPRPDAAEKPRPPRRPRPRRSCFNEAAARCRGKADRRRPGAGGRRRFNEAAARCRGKVGRGMD